MTQSFVLVIEICLDFEFCYLLFYPSRSTKYFTIPIRSGAACSGGGANG